MVIQLKTQMKQLHQLIKRKKKRSHGTQSSFHTLMSRRKKSDTPDDTSQPEPLPLNDDVPNDQVEFNLLNSSYKLLIHSSVDY